MRVSTRICEPVCGMLAPVYHVIAFLYGLPAAALFILNKSGDFCCSIIVEMRQEWVMYTKLRNYVSDKTKYYVVTPTAVVNLWKLLWGTVTYYNCKQHLDLCALRHLFLAGQKAGPCYC